MMLFIGEVKMLYWLEATRRALAPKGLFVSEKRERWGHLQSRKMRLPCTWLPYDEKNPKPCDLDG